jgi:hypothetical protein
MTERKFDIVFELEKFEKEEEYKQKFLSSLKEFKLDRLPVVKFVIPTYESYFWFTDKTTEQIEAIIQDFSVTMSSPPKQGTMYFYCENSNPDHKKKWLYMTAEVFVRENLQRQNLAIVSETGDKTNFENLSLNDIFERVNAA